MLAAVPDFQVSSTSPTVATITPPSVKSKEESSTPCHGRCIIKLSVETF